MPICKECHSRIAPTDRDICPVCGCVHPLSGEGAVPSDTINITSKIKIDDPTIQHDVPRTKQKTFLYFALIGWLGIGFSYLRYNKTFVILWAIGNILVIGGLGALLCFFTLLSYFGFIVSLALVYIVNIVIGLTYKLIPNRKDAIGEFVQ